MNSNLYNTVFYMRITLTQDIPRIVQITYEPICDDKSKRKI